MARENPETSLFTTVPTVLVGERACVLYVPEAKLQAGTATALGTTLQNFMPGVLKGRALTDGYGPYVLSQMGELADGLQAFWFARPRSSDEIATAFRTVEELKQGLYWPPVLTSVAIANLAEYDSTGTSYISNAVWDFVWAKMGWKGPTKVVTEWFASHAPFTTIADPQGMAEMGGTFDYGVRSMSLPPCLHPLLELSFTIPESSRYPVQTFTKEFLATNVTDWPSTLVIEDAQTFENGLYIRQRQTAYKPY